MKHLFLVNPAAGKRGSTEALLRRVEEAFSPLGLEHEVVLTSSAGDAEQLARRAACSGVSPGLMWPPWVSQVSRWRWRESSSFPR